MSYRRSLAVTAAFAFLLTGCGSESSSDAAAKTLDASACAELSDANVNLATATTADEAKAAADVFGKYDPPADAKEAIDRIVAAGGVKFDGSDFDTIKDHIDPWVNEVCPA
jgi:guanyl-specific ribonuclease Sa